MRQPKREIPLEQQMLDQMLVEAYTHAERYGLSMQSAMRRAWKRHVDNANRAGVARRQRRA